MEVKLGLPNCYVNCTQNESIHFQAELGRRRLLNLRAVLRQNDFCNKYAPVHFTEGEGGGRELLPLNHLIPISKFLEKLPQML